MKPRTRKSTLEDVARRAGVHSSTVSRYFSHPEMVAERAKARIRAAVTSLGYTPNRMAGAMAADRRRLIALLVSNLRYPNFNEAVETITSGLEAAGSNVMLCVTGGDPARAEQLITRVLSWRVDAVIAWTPISAAGRRLLRRSGTTTIEICDPAARPVDVGIGFVHAELGAALARFAHGRGYRAPHFVATIGHLSERQRDGFLTEWRQLGMSGSATVQIIETPPTVELGRPVYRQLARLRKPADVVLCPSDYLALAVMMEARGDGRSVPGNLAVIGLGNSPIAGEMRPGITTVDIHTDRMAPEILRVLESRAQGEAPRRQHIDLGFRIIVRDSA